MRALVCHQLSTDRSGLCYEPDWPEPPPPGAGEVLVAIEAAALNFPDLLMLSGGYQYLPSLPFIPGTEACGRIITAGPGVALPVGSQVIVGGRGGGFAERMTLPATSVRAVPVGLNAAEAAAFTVGALTAWVGLVERGRLRAGERVMVAGAGGGMGLAAVALAVSMGAEVVAVASSGERLDAARATGAHQGVQIDRSDPAAALRDLARDFDIVFDCVGGTLLAPAIRLLHRGGRYLVIGFTGGRPAPLPLNRALLQEIEIIGVRAGEQGRQNPAAGRAHIAAIDARAAQLKPLIGLSLPLEQGAAAFDAMASGHLVGKAVLTMG